MASVTRKQLKEHLQERQEPFTLNIYLAERGYLVKCLSSNGTRNGCSCHCQINLFNKYLGRSCSCNLINKKMFSLSSTARIVKSILCKLVPANDNQGELQNSELANGLTPRSCVVEGESLPSETSQASKLGNVEQHKTLRDKTWQKHCSTEDKYLNLMSMLDQLSSDKVHHIITRQERASISRRCTTMTEHGHGGVNLFIFTTFPWKLLGKSLVERYSLSLIGLKEVGKENIESSCIKNNIGISKQVKKQYNYNYNYIEWFNIGVGKVGINYLIRAEQMVYWCKQNRSSLDLHSKSDSDALEEWNYYSQKQKRKICCELGDGIMDEILVEEIIDLLLLHYC